MKRRTITPDQINRLFSILLAFFLVVGGFLYWLGYIQKVGLILVVIIVLTSGILFTFGIRVVQKDGFLDGYVRGKDNFDKKKK